MTKEQSKIIRSYKTLQVDAHCELTKIAISMIESVNGHNLDDCRIMFPEPIIMMESRDRARTSKNVSMYIVSGVCLTKHEGSEPLIATLDSDNEMQHDFSTGLSISMKMEIIDALMDVLKNE